MSFLNLSNVYFNYVVNLLKNSILCHEVQTQSSEILGRLIYKKLLTKDFMISNYLTFYVSGIYSVIKKAIYDKCHY